MAIFSSILPGATAAFVLEQFTEDHEEGFGSEPPWAWKSGFGLGGLNRAPTSIHEARKSERFTPHQAAKLCEVVNFWHGRNGSSSL